MQATAEPLPGYKMGYLLCGAISALSVYGSMYVSDASDAGGELERGKRVCHCDCVVCGAYLVLIVLRCSFAVRSLLRMWKIFSRCVQSPGARSAIVSCLYPR